jgi:hypothetical protein
MLIHILELADDGRTGRSTIQSEKMDPETVKMFAELLQEGGPDFTTELSVLELPRLSFTWRRVPGPLAVAYFRLNDKPALLCLLVGGKNPGTGMLLLAALRAAIATEVREATGEDLPDDSLPLTEERPLLVGRFLPLEAHNAGQRRMIFDYAACLAVALFCG